MVGSGKTVGIILMVVAAVLLLAFGGWAAVALGSSETSSGGAALGILLALLVVGPFLASAPTFSGREARKRKTTLRSRKNARS